jgi:metal transporter CNNM
VKSLLNVSSISNFEESFTWDAKLDFLVTAVCARYGLRIGAATAPFVLALMYLEFPIAYPIAKLLDYLLGEETGTLYKKAELKTFVGLHRRE